MALTLMSSTVHVSPETLDVLGEVASERERQIEVHGSTADHDDAHGLPEWSWLLLRRVSELACPFDEAIVDARRQLVEVAAIAVAAIEALDRAAGHEPDGG